MKVRPSKNHLLVKIIENEESTKSGILLTGTAKGESNIAQIIETPEFFDDDRDVYLKGDKILITPDAGIPVKLDAEGYRIITYKEVLAALDW